ncbi:MAG: hypothetical protein KKF44_09695 [Nanoarchaeota archaeon]|nr:hypothetical protein [Nanoarchaeota archaeon]
MSKQTYSRFHDIVGILGALIGHQAIYTKTVFSCDQGIPNNLELNVDRLYSLMGTKEQELSSGNNLEIIFGEGYSVDSGQKSHGSGPYISVIEPNESYLLDIDNKGVQLKMDINIAGCDYEMDETYNGKKLTLNYNEIETANHMCAPTGDMGFDSVQIKKEINFGSDLESNAETLAALQLEGLIVFSSKNSKVSVYTGEDIGYALRKQDNFKSNMNYVAIGKNNEVSRKAA